MFTSIPTSTKFPPNSYDFEQKLYSYYVRWNGRTDLDHNGLQLNRTYKVIKADVQSSSTALYLEDLLTGRTLTNEYNSVLFTPLKGFIGLCTKKPIVNERTKIYRINSDKTMSNVTTSHVIAIEWVSDSVINIVTENSVYTCSYMV